ncbi:ribosome-binding factor A [Streptomyces lydicamycinicus]|uniref:Ribosome-binding factor A n=1 Tax=Streptomyces lydicamycinicus TaxID=1546107 RepID=A0A0P4R725_9ACTN|nr:ribosome-binding factor A [Streptomyces lydicamycinicus]
MARRGGVPERGRKVNEQPERRQQRLRKKNQKRTAVIKAATVKGRRIALGRINQAEPRAADGRCGPVTELGSVRSGGEESNSDRGHLRNGPTGQGLFYSYFGRFLRRPT